MFVHEDDDPRADGGWANDERSVLLGFLSDRRLTLEIKCADLDAEQMARQSVPPSDMSLLGLVRHLTSVENYWSQKVILGIEGERLYHDGSGNDVTFVVRPDSQLVDSVWRAWRAEVANTGECVKKIADLGQLAEGNPTPVREILVHLIREYAQHLGHADLIRERIDGRVGQ
jgi:hypothetical protein